MARNSMGNLDQRLKARTEQLERGIEKTVSDAAYAAGERVITKTPIDTGRAKLNWQTTMDRQAQGTRPAPAEPSAGKRTALKELRLVTSAYKLGHMIYINNNLPYIKRLNDGYSKQAPAMFVEEAVEAGVQSVKNAKLLK